MTFAPYHVPFYIVEELVLFYFSNTVGTASDPLLWVVLQQAREEVEGLLTEPVLVLSDQAVLSGEYVLHLAWDVVRLRRLLLLILKWI